MALRINRTATGLNSFSSASGTARHDDYCPHTGILQLKSFGSQSKLAGNRSGSLCTGLWVPCRIFSICFGSTLGRNSGSVSKTSGRILKNVPGPFSYAELAPEGLADQPKRYGSQLSQLRKQHGKTCRNFAGASLRLA